MDKSDSTSPVISTTPERRVDQRTEVPGAFPEEVPGAFHSEIPLPLTPPREIQDESTTGHSVETNEPEPPKPVEQDQMPDTLGFEVPAQNAVDNTVDGKLERQLLAEPEQPRATREIIRDVDAGNILEGPRKRKARSDDDYAAYDTTQQCLKCDHLPLHEGSRRSNSGQRAV